MKNKFFSPAIAFILGFLTLGLGNNVNIYMISDKVTYDKNGNVFFPMREAMLNFITFGIYGLVVMSSVSTDINTIATRYDGKKTMHYCLLFFIFSWLTFGIAPIVWFHKVSSRIGSELYRRGIAYSFSASSYWLWAVLGSFIFVGPFVYYHKLFKAMNLLAADFNVNG